MGLLDEIANAEDVEELLLPIPMLKTTAYPDGGQPLLFRGLTFNVLAKLQGTFDIAAVEKQDLESMITLISLTTYDPDTRVLLFDSERGREVLRGLGYKTLLFMLQKGSTVVVGTDEAETAGKDSSSELTATAARDDSSFESHETPVAQSESFSPAPPQPSAPAAAAIVSPEAGSDR